LAGRSRLSFRTKDGLEVFGRVRNTDFGVQHITIWVAVKTTVMMTMRTHSILILKVIEL
jgi:hypothetical protein